jgi:tripartite-type tricarboxylate transporter receptor subunit TctC
MKSQLKALFFCVVTLGGATAAWAEWPERPVTIVVPFAAGGNTDSIARITAEWLTKQLKQTVIVDNKPGANGAIAAEYVARAQGDGYTLFMATLPQMAILPHLQKVRYDPVRSFLPVSIIATNPFALAVANNVPANTLADLVKLAKAKPGQIAYASAGNGSVSHLSIALFLQRAGIKMNHIPYKGGAPAISDVLGGQVPMYFGNLAEIIPQYKSGKFKVMAVSSDKRVNQMPDVPTIAEQGYAGFSTYTWNAVAAPAGTPKEVINTLSKAIRSASQDAAFLAKLSGIGVDALCNSPEEFANILNKDIVKWGEAVKLSGAKAE